ncbi:MAG: folate-binding protein [Methylovulum sp.]|nr:folate-binding protein [Methylovulum sp.]
MNPIWKNFLRSEQADVETDAQISFPANADGHKPRIYALAHLAVLTISGNDAANLLQGQISCNIRDLSETQSSLGALCNPKGRAIATFLLIKTDDIFLMVLPVELLATVKKRLGMYILRSDVLLTDSSDSLCVLGWKPPSAQLSDDEALFSTLPQVPLSINLGQRRLLVARPETAIAWWTEQTRHGCLATSSAQWRYLDIIAGLPWLTTATSEAFIPQMLNLDKLGGISFTKGCYTGQEIIARTHYLGKAKRAMFLAECQTPEMPAPNTVIFDDSLPDSSQPAETPEQDQAAGRVLLAAQQDGICKMLIVIPISETGTYQLKLADQHKLALLALPYSI